MLKLNLAALEKKLGKKLKKNFTSLGFDCASRTGWAILKTTDKECTLDFGVISTDTKDFYYKYDKMIELFATLINKIRDDENKIVIIEDTFFSKNVNTLKILSRIGMIVYVLASLKGMNKQYMLATQARMKLGFKGNQKKELIHKQFSDKFNFKMIDIDVIDAVILAFAGCIDTEEIL